MVLANYSGKCAVTGIDIPELLLAGHIIPWSENEKERLNPENGICFSPLYDKAFECGLVGIDTNYKILLSPKLKDFTSKEYYNYHFKNIEGKTIHQPLSYLPKKEFLEWRLNHRFGKHT
jgi:putative restriction endonuclease